MDAIRERARAAAGMCHRVESRGCDHLKHLHRHPL
jgi:hypothetical protein